jgi:UDPglucose--hexose-1-phosphate uridylyltransferase
MNPQANKHLQDYSHKRLNILTGEWVLVSPHRAKRPWQGQEEAVSQELRPAHDPSCYLCARNTRINGEVNPDYSDVFVFINDFAALQTTSPDFTVQDGLLVAQSERGLCKVVCFSPDHSKSLADMSVVAIEKVVHTWQKEYLELGAHKMINYVQIFENKGAVMGCSNPHPHGQIWSQATLPNEVAKKHEHQKAYFLENKSSLLGDYLEQELAAKVRVIYENEYFVVLTPFWAVWPFESMIVPRNQYAHIAQITVQERTAFADAIAKITRAYDALFACSFPYSSGIHQSPTDGKVHEHWHFHMSFYPPLLRSATVKKFMVGYEMFGSPQRDITAEQAAERLRGVMQ